MQGIPIVARGATFAFLADGVVLAETLARVGVAGFRMAVAVAFATKALFRSVRIVGEDSHVAEGAFFAREAGVTLK